MTARKPRTQLPLPRCNRRSSYEHEARAYVATALVTIAVSAGGWFGAYLYLF